MAIFFFLQRSFCCFANINHSSSLLQVLEVLEVLQVLLPCLQHHKLLLLVRVASLDMPSPRRWRQVTCSLQIGKKRHNERPVSLGPCQSVLAFKQLELALFHYKAATGFISVL